MDKIITNSKTEIHSLNNSLEDLAAKWDKVETFIQIEANLRKELEDTKEGLELEKKARHK